MTRLAFTTRVLKPLAFVAALIPLARLVAETFGFGYLGADPVHTVQVVTGLSTLVLLLLTLAVTPLRKLLGWSELIRLRRMLGLFAFFYLVLHALIYFVLDQSLDPGLIWADTVEHPRIAVGFAAFLLLIPLAVTSTDRMIRRLGRRWGKLHRLVYAATTLGVLHYLMVQKLDIREGLVYGAIFGGLMVFRLQGWVGRIRTAVSGRPSGAAVARPSEDLP
ncbi:MAG TPA: protein-methionine-sulfoxide reductase heme-binding subunit MsrQ [Gemmatimonadales bacterium]|nr:protein-methionine-sulfoxide reductase heme-binding subunit MsrQ [Gemmatimonadales bacterium]